MAKGKHAPTKGAIREDKIIHPKSRKAAKMHNKEQRKLKMSGKVSVGGQRLQILGEKLLWFHENLNVVLQEEEGENVSVTAEDMLELINAYILRNQDEKDQIKLKNSIGSGQFRKRNQHQSRLDAIDLAYKTESEEFHGCGLEVPDLFEEENLKKFRDWNSELRFIQNFKLKRVSLRDLAIEQASEQDENCENESQDSEMITG